MRKRRLSGLMVIGFVVAFVGTASTAALATPHWSRVAVGTGNGSYGGGGMGCSSQAASQTQVNEYCPIPVDGDTVTGFTFATAYFVNSNPTQPTYACVAYSNQTGGACSGTAANNCPNRGVCSFNLNISAWQNNPSHFKYIEFDNLTIGALVSGYVVGYNTP